jgi:hypothetical protein
MSVTPLHPPTTPATARFAPLPLVSGEHITSDTGTHDIKSVTVTIVDATGQVSKTALELRNGGWWAPSGALDPTTA